MDSEIVKIQIDITGTNCLIYNESRSLECQVPASDELLDLMNGEVKKFFECNILPDGQVGMIAEAEWQEW